MFNVKEFGAVADGRHDDTAAIQKAIDAAADTAGTVVLPSGIYACSTLRMRPHTGLSGFPSWGFREFGGTILRLADEKASCLIDITGAFGVTLDGLCLDGAGLGRDIPGVLLDKPDYGKQEDTFRVERCRIGQFSGDGMRLVRAWCFSVRHSMVGYNGGNGIRLRGWDGFLVDNWLSCNREAGFGAYDENSSTTFTANRVEWNRKGGMILHGGKNYNITGNYFDRAGGPAIGLCRRQEKTPCRNLTITGNILYRSGAPKWHAVEECEDCHLWMDHASGVTVVGNSMTVGCDDGDKGVWSPRFGIVYRGLSQCVVQNNVLRNGAMEALLHDLGGHGADVVVGNNPGSVGKPEA